MRKATTFALTNVESECDNNSDTAKLMRFCQLIIELDNKRLEAERKEGREQDE